MNNKNTIFFTSCNNEYVPCAVVSLLKIRQYDPSANLAVISKNLTLKNKRILERKKIQIIDIDLSDAYKVSWEYPAECYYFLAGPELFLKQGYKYSVYIDADVVCLGCPYLKQDIKGVAGVPHDRLDCIFANDFEKIQKIFTIDKNYKNRKRIQSGVLYFNNEFAKKKNLYLKTKELFLKSLDERIPRKGDDSLFALFQLTHCRKSDVKYLPQKYNYMGVRNQGDDVAGDVVFFHFAFLAKPWNVSRDGVIRRPYQEYRKFALVVSPSIILHKTIIARIVIKLGKHIKSLYYWATRQQYCLLRRIKNIRKPPLRAYWFRRDPELGIRNFGDELSTPIANTIFGYNIEWCWISECEIAMIGSLMEFINERCEDSLNVWGCGFIEDGNSKISNQNICINAVRGKRSLARIKAERDVALGDPGIFASICYPKRRLNKTGKIGVVLHYVDSEHPLAQRIRENPNYCLISTLDKPEVVAAQISGCRAIISSSLHGLILADSYKIPNAHVLVTDKVIGGDYKFKDYCSGVGKEYISIDKDDIFNKAEVQRIIDNYKPIKLTGIRRKLVRSFPYK